MDEPFARALRSAVRLRGEDQPETAGGAPTVRTRRPLGIDGQTLAGGAASWGLPIQPPLQVGGAALRRSMRSRLAGKILRKVLRLLKPVLLPFLNRFQNRLQYAVDTSEIARSMPELDQRITTLEATLVRLINSNGNLVRDLLSDLDSHFSRIDRKIDEVRDGISATAAERKTPSARIVPRQDTRQDTRQDNGAGSALFARIGESYHSLPVEDAELLALFAGGRLPEPTARRVFEHLLAPGDVVVDVGAHLGLYAIAGARIVGAQGHVVAVEPVPATAGHLARTVEVNGLGQVVELVQAAAGAFTGEALLHLGPCRSAGSLHFPAGEAAETLPVPVRTLDSMIAPGARVDLVKIDAAGAEFDVWAGMRRILAENPALIVLVEVRPPHPDRIGLTSEDWLGRMVSDRFDAWEIDEATGKCRPLRAPGDLRAAHAVRLVLLPKGGARHLPQDLKDPADARG